MFDKQYMCGILYAQNSTFIYNNLSDFVSIVHLNFNEVQIRPLLGVICVLLLNFNVLCKQTSVKKS